jgi:ATP-dependent helicase/nuclease subunit A
MSKGLNAQLNDQQARADIVRCLNETLMVEAGAGTGKTKSLVDRMVALVTGAKCPVSRIAAVTFTRKAAGELEKRFQIALEEKLRSAADLLEKERAAAALADLDSAFIGTIHSFCSRILRERPVEAGVSPGFTEIEGVDEKLLCRAAWDDYLLQLHLDDPEGLLADLAKVDLAPEQLQEAYGVLSGYPDLEFPAPKAAYPDLKPLRKQLMSFMTLASSHMPQTKPQKRDNLQNMVLRAERWLRMHENDQPGPSADLALLRFAAALDKNASRTIKCWDSKDDCLAVEAAFEELRNKFVVPVLESWRAYRYHFVTKFLQPAAEHYKETRRRLGSLNFQDLLMLTAEMLRLKAEVRQYFQDRFTHLLIDEFQDTDPIQAEIMLYLTGVDRDEKDWLKLKPRPGSLFVVGDPKQSIYRFRRADIDTYNQVKEIIETSGGRTLNLTTNFRSQPPLIEWFNNTFSSLFPKGKSQHQADFVKLDSPPDKKALTEPPVQKIVIPDVKGSYANPIAEADAEQIASVIGAEISKKGNGRSAADFMIIVRVKKRMSVYARALEKMGITYRITGQSDISESEEIFELLRVLKALADPDNPVSLVSALRGLFFGVSDGQLYQFKQAGGKFNFISKLPNSNKAVPDQIEKAYTQLKHFYKLTRQLPPSSALEQIAAELGLIPLIMAGELARSKAGYYYRLLEGLRACEQEKITTFPAAVEYLGRLLDEGFEDELTLEGEDTPAVRLLNLHKAKGLEAPVIFLADPGYNKDHEPTIHVRRTGGKSEGYLVISKKVFFNSEVLAHHPDWKKGLQDEESSYDEAEELRLLYVAATRAGDSLIVSTYPKNENLSAWVKLNQYLPGDALQIQAAAPQVVKPAGTRPVAPTDLQQAEKDIEDRKATLKTATYRHTSATAVKDDSITLPERSLEGYGLRWGTVVHEALDLLVAERTNSDPDKLQQKLKLAIEREELDQQRLPDIMQVLEGFKASVLWSRISQAREVHREMAFGLWQDSTYTTGIMDLVFLEDKGWVIVDYKTDRIEDKAHLDKLIQYYRPQVELYKSSFEAATGLAVSEAALYFIDQQHYEPLK